MRAAARWMVGVLAAVMLCGAAGPAEAFFSRSFRKKMARTFRPIKKVRHIQKITKIRHAFGGSRRSSRTASRRRTYRRTRAVRRR